MSRLTVTLEQDEREALRVKSVLERRDMGDQAALFIREKLIECGLLPADTPATIAVLPMQLTQAAQRDR